MSGLNSDQMLVLDGGCGLELKRRKTEGRDIAYDLELFSTASLLKTPQAIVDLHRDYVLAGANVITTASYAVTRFHLDKINRGRDLQHLAALSVELARKGVRESQSVAEVLVASCVPPLSESYRADLVPSNEVLHEQYSELIPALGEGDLYLCETISNLREAAVSVPLCVQTGKPVWASFTLTGTNSDDVCIPDGTSVSDAVKTVLDFGVQGVLFNCAAPELFDLALPIASRVIAEEFDAKGAGQSRPRPRLGAYGNFWTNADRSNWSMSDNESQSGKGDQASGSGFVVRSDLGAEPYAKMAEVWRDQWGASIVGGCCGIGPEHIKCISDTLTGREFEAMPCDPLEIVQHAPGVCPCHSHNTSRM